MAYYFRYLKYLAMIAGLCIISSCSKQYKRPAYQSWTPFYGLKAEPEVLMEYDLVIVQSNIETDIQKVQQSGTKVLAYISLGELSDHEVKTYLNHELSHIIIGKNKAWKSHIVDIRKKEWRDYILHSWLPRIKARHFDGVMIDTVDTALQKHLPDQTIQELEKASAQLIRDIRTSLGPDKLMMVNRGLDILPEIASDIDIILAESILIDANHPDRPYFSESVHQYYVNKLQGLKQKYSHLTIFTLDYPKTIDKTAWLDICSRHVGHGFVPHISTLNLNKLHSPKPWCF